MKRLSTSALARGTLVACLLMGSAARADDDCEVPMSDWLPRSAVVRLAAESGWTVRRIRIDDGCYEIIGTDAEGRAIEVKLDPGTLAVVEMEFEEHHRDSGSFEGNED